MLQALVRVFVAQRDLLDPVLRVVSYLAATQPQFVSSGQLMRTLASRKHGDLNAFPG